MMATNTLRKYISIKTKFDKAIEAGLSKKNIIFHLAQNHFVSVQTVSKALKMDLSIIEVKQKKVENQLTIF